jgi:hypothetical protein
MSKQHNNDQNNGGRSARERYSESANTHAPRKVPDWMKAILNVSFVIPVLFLILYVSGIWDLKIEEGKLIRDGWDDFVIPFVCCTGALGLILLNTVFFYYESK